MSRSDRGFTPITTDASDLEDYKQAAEVLRNEVKRLQYALQRIANCGQSVEPDHWKFRCMAREVAAEALKQ